MEEPKPSVLVVDDEVFNLEILGEYLEDADYAPVMAENGLEAWSLLEKEPERFAAVLLDRMMPGIDGMEVLTRIKAHPALKALPVIMQTAVESNLRWEQTMKQILCLLGLLGCLSTAPVSADQTLHASRVEHAPVVDGSAQDPLWGGAKAVVTRDRVAEIDITLQAVYTADEIFFLVRFPDATENRMHKMLQWDKELEIYKPGPTREDSMVLKWSMEPLPVDMYLTSEQPYKADIWFWKSYRTGHAGYADDKYQIYSDMPLQKSKRLLSGEGKTFYLIRKGDAGQSAYTSASPIEYQGEEVPTYKLRKPSGSRADIRAKGQWESGFWSVEFSRKLVTGHADDIALQPGRSYRFGVSRYEIAGRKAEPDIENPLYGAGDIGEHLTLQFR